MAGAVFAMPWAIWNCLPGCWLDRRWKESVGQWVEHISSRTSRAGSHGEQHYTTAQVRRGSSGVPVDIGDLVGWTRHFFEPIARQSQITLSLQNCVAGVSFPADRRRLDQVLLNLISTVFRAMPNGGWIELGAGEFLLAD